MWVKETTHWKVLLGNYCEIPLFVKLLTLLLCGVEVSTLVVWETGYRNLPR